MFSPRGGGPGIPGGFDILFNSRVNFPAVGTISCVKCPSPRGGGGEVYIKWIAHSHAPTNKTIYEQTRFKTFSYKLAFNTN